MKLHYSGILLFYVSWTRGLTRCYNTRVFQNIYSYQATWWLNSHVHNGICL